MKIKRAIATVAVLGGLASLAYAQRPSATCPEHGVSGHPTGAPINDKRAVRVRAFNRRWEQFNSLFSGVLLLLIAVYSFLGRSVHLYGAYRQCKVTAS